MFKSIKSGRIFSNIITYTVLTILCVFVLFPFLWMISSSIKPVDEVRSLNATFITLNPTLESYRRIIFGTQYMKYFLNSLLVSFSTTFLALIISILVGYALTRLIHIKGIRFVKIALIASQMIPAILLIIPLYLMIFRLKLLDTHMSLIITYTTFAIPFSSFFLLRYFSTIPEEIEESAMIDGCSRLNIILKIYIPICLPALVATFTFVFVLCWNEFLFAYTFINRQDLRTLGPGITEVIGQYRTDWGGLMAASVLMVIPVVLIFTYIQKYLIEGLGYGAVKG